MNPAEGDAADVSDRTKLLICRNLLKAHNRPENPAIPLGFVGPVAGLVSAPAKALEQFETLWNILGTKPSFLGEFFSAFQV